MDVVAEEVLTTLFADGRTGTVHLRVGRPRPCEGGEWACAVEIEGLPGWRGPVDVFGVVALQAMSLGLGFLRSSLMSQAAGGARFRFPGEEEDVDLSVLFWREAGT